MISNGYANKSIRHGSIVGVSLVSLPKVDRAVYCDVLDSVFHNGQQCLIRNDIFGNIEHLTLRINKVYSYMF